MKHYATIASTLALVIALTGVGAVTASKLHLISGKQIRNNSVKPKDVKFPRARPLSGQARAAKATAHASATVGTDFSPIAVLGNYAKATPDTVLQVTWSGTATSSAGGQNLGCILQLRLDGKPPDGNAGQVYVATAGATISVTAQALWSTAGTGSHEVEVFAREAPDATGPSECRVDLPETTVQPTANAVEVVQ